MRKFTILVFIILCIPLNAWSMDLQIMVTGLYRDHAVVEINGQQHFLSVDQQTPEGVTLISANSSQAILAGCIPHHQKCP